MLSMLLYSPFCSIYKKDWVFVFDFTWIKFSTGVNQSNSIDIAAALCTKWETDPKFPTDALEGELTVDFPGCNRGNILVKKYEKKI